MDRQFWVYILASVSRVVYIGVISDLEKRVWEHKTRALDGFSQRYNVDRLVYEELYGRVDDAIAREKQPKGWSRAKKIALIERENSEWADLAYRLFQMGSGGSCGGSPRNGLNARTMSTRSLDTVRRLWGVSRVRDDGAYYLGRAVRLSVSKCMHSEEIFMHFRDIIRTRRMIRRFTNEPVADEVLERIIDAGNRGPSAGFSQGVSFISITNEETRRKVAAVCGERGYVAAGFGPFVSQAPVQIVICTSEAIYRERYAQPDKRRAAARDPMFPVPYWFTDAGAAIMLILLAAVDEGLGSAFVGIHDQPGIRSLLGIPIEVTPVGVVLIGHPTADKRSRSLKRGRKSPHEVHHRERWS